MSINTNYFQTRFVNLFDYNIEFDLAKYSEFIILYNIHVCVCEKLIYNLININYKIKINSNSIILVLNKVYCTVYFKRDKIFFLLFRND